MLGNLRRMQMLHLSGADVNASGICCTPLFLAAGSGNAEAVRYLINQGADVNSRERFGQTALTEAAFYGNISVIKELLKHGAEVNAVSDEGTALKVITRHLPIYSNTMAHDEPAKFVDGADVCFYYDDQAITN